MTVDDGVGRARELIAEAVGRLQAAGVPDEALGEYVQPRAVLGIRREPTIRALGRVWRVGALLLGASDDTAGRVWATGTITRVTEPGRAQYQSQSAEVRRAYRAAAERGHFAHGDTVNHGARAIGLDDGLVDGDGVLFVRDGEPLVRWSRSGGDPIALGRYLTDRVDLLVHPPRGATD